MIIFPYRQRHKTHITRESPLKWLCYPLVTMLEIEQLNFEGP